jgi:hypothetical protein
MTSPYGSDTEAYAANLAKYSDIIKSQCPDCKVIFGGMSGYVKDENDPSAHYLEEVLVALEGIGDKKYFDWFVVHFPCEATDYKEMKNSATVRRNIMERHGYEDKPILMTEMSTYDGEPADFPIEFPPQSESEQAIDICMPFL